ncbi:MAG TPA: hypothetical protein VMO88_02655 [Acidimicrobiales bacterium]|nr:hypothetical protein [Acidimicrobiales bacterium]
MHEQDGSCCAVVIAAFRAPIQAVELNTLFYSYSIDGWAID